MFWFFTAFDRDIVHTQPLQRESHFYPFNINLQLGSSFQSLHLYTLLYPAPMSSFLPPPNMESLPSISSELLRLLEDRQIGKQALGGWGDGGADGGWRRGCEEQCSQGCQHPHMCTLTWTHIHTDTEEPVHFTHWHTHQEPHTMLQVFPLKPPSEAPLWFNWCNYICIRLSCLCYRHTHTYIYTLLTSFNQRDNWIWSHQCSAPKGLSVYSAQDQRSICLFRQIGAYLLLDQLLIIYFKG